MTDTTFIYALLEPETDDIRYVGKANDVKKRLMEHINCRDKGKTHKTQWVYSLRKLGKEPKLIVLEEVPIKQWQEAERRWIAHYRDVGARLTNIHPGGWGGSTKGRKRRHVSGGKVIRPKPGRPFLSDTERTVKIEVIMPASLAEKLDKIAPNNRSAWIRQAIETAQEVGNESEADHSEYDGFLAQIEKRRELFNQRQGAVQPARQAGQARTEQP